MELLKKLYSIHSMSGQEHAMRKFIKKYVKAMPGDISCVQDHGNIYIVKGEGDSFPCVVAHLDQVQRNHSKDFEVIRIGDNLIGFGLELMRQEGLGADDKNGIWIALKALAEFDTIKVAFFWGEETGCEGSSACNIDFFKDCRFIIQPDRRGAHDLITNIGGLDLMSTDFRLAIDGYATYYGFDDQSGLMTDVEQLVLGGCGVSCFNVSCGYHNPHTDTEYTSIPELENTKDFIFDIIRNVTEVYPHAVPEGYLNRYKNWYGNGYAWDDFYYGRGSFANKNKGLTTVGQTMKKDYGYEEDEFKSGPTLVSVANYGTPEDAIDALARYNCKYYFGEELWPYVSSEFETYGVDKWDFCALYDDAAEAYLEYFAYNGDDCDEQQSPAYAR